MQSTLVFAEHDGAKLNPSTRHAITAAKAIGGDISALVAGPKCGDVAKEVAAIGGLSKVRLAMRANIHHRSVIFRACANSKVWPC